MKHRIYGLLLLSCWVGLLDAHAEQRISQPDTLKQQQIKEVVVTAGRHKKNVGEIKRTAEQLKLEMPVDMNDLVRYIPSVGVSISGSRGGMRGFTIRGVEANRVAISIDGILQPEIQDNVVFSSYGLSNSSRIDFDPYFASSIKIQKGANHITNQKGNTQQSCNSNRGQSKGKVIKPDRIFFLKFPLLARMNEKCLA